MRKFWEVVQDWLDFIGDLLWDCIKVLAKAVLLVTIIAWLLFTLTFISSLFLALVNILEKNIW